MIALRVRNWIPKSLTFVPKMIRITHPWGNGEWHPPSDREMLQGECDRLNGKYGGGTHFIEKRSGSKIGTQQ